MSVYPKKDLPFLILFTAGLCSFTATLAMLTHQFPELMGIFAKAVSLPSRSRYCYRYRCLRRDLHLSLKPSTQLPLSLNVDNIIVSDKFLSTLFAPLGFFVDKVESFMPSSFWHQLT
ncbi:hypothetical protein AAFF_G00409320 [Aldrovandia affinis]|uniref:Protein ST7 homolog n=1 Tax=Aldrovandia affinis TaxID=143900 RepID=A0AAD7WJN9_9TELE|nr:hypothetical protein AAFF_G00409320 [Aldrovandia affinis]